MSITKFLLLLGSSGAGKSSITRVLRKLDSRYVYITHYTNRLLREGETDKVSVADAEIDRMAKTGEFLVVEKFGRRYAIPWGTVHRALELGNFPLLDWPADMLNIMQEAFVNRLYVVYIAPPSMESLMERMARDGRNSSNERLQSAEAELEAYYSGKFAPFLDLEIVNHDGQIEMSAKKIHTAYLKSLHE